MDRKCPAGYNTRRTDYEIYLPNNWKKNTVTKEEAIVKVLRVLKSPMLVMSKPNRDEALTLAEEYGIMAKDLIDSWTKIAERI